MILRREEMLIYCVNIELSGLMHGKQTNPCTPIKVMVRENCKIKTISEQIIKYYVSEVYIKLNCLPLLVNHFIPLRCKIHAHTLIETNQG